MIDITFSNTDNYIIAELSVTYMGLSTVFQLTKNDDNKYKILTSYQCSETSDNIQTALDYILAKKDITTIHVVFYPECNENEREIIQKYLKSYASEGNKW